MDKKVRFKILSYIILLILCILVVSIFMPFYKPVDSNQPDTSIRLHREDNSYIEETSSSSGNSFRECDKFGIRKLINDYYDAYSRGDEELILKYVDTFGSMDEDNLHFAGEYVEQYMDISCYIMEGYVKDSYLVVAYGYSKFYDIDTTIPVIGKFFVRANTSGDYYICNSEVSNECTTFNELMFEGKQVEELRSMAEYEIETAIEVDKKLSGFLMNNSKYFEY